MRARDARRPLRLHDVRQITIYEIRSQNGATSGGRGAEAVVRPLLSNDVCVLVVWCRYGQGLVDAVQRQEIETRMQATIGYVWPTTFPLFNYSAHMFYWKA